MLDQLATAPREVDHGSDNSNWTWALAISPDGTRLAYAFNQVELRIRDLKTGTLTRSVNLQARNGPVQLATLRFSPDGKQLAAASWARSATNTWLMDAETGETTRVFLVNFATKGLAFSLDGRSLAVGGDHPDVMLFTSTGNYLVTVWDVTANVAALPLNQQLNGAIETPYFVGRWVFSSVVRIASELAIKRLVESIRSAVRMKAGGST